MLGNLSLVRKLLRCIYSLLFHTFLRAKKKLPPMDLSFTCFHLQSTTSNTSCWGMPLVRWSSGTQDAYVEFFFGWACLETTMKPASSWPWIWSLGRVFFSSKSPLGLIVFQIITLYVQISNLKNCKLRRVWICLWTFLGNLWKGHQNKVYVIPKWLGLQFGCPFAPATNPKFGVDFFSQGSRKRWDRNIWLQSPCVIRCDFGQVFVGSVFCLASFLFRKFSHQDFQVYI